MKTKKIKIVVIYQTRKVSRNLYNYDMNDLERMIYKFSSNFFADHFFKFYGKNKKNDQQTLFDAFGRTIKSVVYSLMKKQKKKKIANCQNLTQIIFSLNCERRDSFGWGGIAHSSPCQPPPPPRKSAYKGKVRIGKT